MAWLDWKIYYTVDGSDPRLRGGEVSPIAQVYKDPISLAPGQRIIARVRSDHALWSAPVLAP